MSGEYDPTTIEAKWQAYWEAHKTFRTPNPGHPGFDAGQPKFYALDMFPYPSGSGLHVGHPEGYTATDIVARYRRMRGYNVLHPMGWDAFGLPAEQHAVDTGQHPAVTTERNINNFRRQLKQLGFSYDWDREVATTDPAYFRWTQWIFLKLFNSWYDEQQHKARPIEALRVPDEVSAGGASARRSYIDSHRLAYLAEVPVNWCPALGTVLANEEVTNEGRSERGNHPVYRRPLKQWMLRITKYADRLERDLEELDWPASVKLMQKNWIGRSEGARVTFRMASDQGRDLDQSRDRKGAEADLGASIEIFTTRPDTLFGATYMVLAPEHPLVERVTTDEQRQAVKVYCEAAIHRSELDRTADTKDKTGVFTGGYAINPVNEARIPIWVADYVLMGYGTGAIMAVPGSDTRDYEFARALGLPIVQVVAPPSLEHASQGIWVPEGETAEYETTRDEQGREYVRIDRGCYPGEGIAVNSPGATGEAQNADALQRAKDLCELNGLPSKEAKAKINDWLEEKGLGQRAVNYKLRDWLFSRQRYWGEPFPILHGPDGEIVALDESELPLELPPMDDFAPQAMPDGRNAVPEPPLGRAKAWALVERDGKTYRRELNTMPQWAGSCWYYLRFCDAQNPDRFCGREAEQYWMVSKRKDGKPHLGGIDLYLGGAEHAVLHLLYARFWHKVLYDLGEVSTIEPFGKLFNQGMIRAFAYLDSRGTYIALDEVDLREGGAYHKKTGERLTATVEKMSKSLKNVINPEEVVDEFGADALRLYEMFMGPLEASKPWNPRDVPGVHRFLQRTWRLMAGADDGAVSDMVSDGPADPELERALHKTIKKVGEDIERLAFNTAISAMMEFVNAAYRAKGIARDQGERFVLILAPFAPHIAEELWQRLRGEKWNESLTYEPWPSYDAALLVEDEVEIPIQVNGKLAGRIRVPKDAEEAVIQEAALAEEKVAARLGGALPVKTIYVPGRLMNLIVKK